MLPSTSYHGGPGSVPQLSSETQAAHTSHLHNLLVQQLSDILEYLFSFTEGKSSKYILLDHHTSCLILKHGSHTAIIIRQTKRQVGLLSIN